jgi:hypothetical protein
MDRNRECPGTFNKLKCVGKSLVCEKQKEGWEVKSTRKELLVVNHWRFAPVEWLYPEEALLLKCSGYNEYVMGMRPTTADLYSESLLG